jgi:hypothetical protein
LPSVEAHMTTVDFIIELFCQVDDRLKGAPKHPQASLWPSEVVTLAMRHALNGVGNRAFYRWLARDGRELFPQLPERTRLFRLFKTPWRWSYAFMAEVTLLGVADTYGIELLHPIREGRRRAPRGRTGLSTQRWIVGVKRGVLLNRWGLVVGWVWAPADTHDVHFQPLVQAVEDRLLVVADSSFPAATGDPANLKVCRRGEWNDRMLIETVLSMLTTISHLKKVSHRVAAYVQARLAFTMAVFNLLARWYGLPADEDGFVPLSIAEFSL